jgi:hypothetical protein
VDSYYEEGVFYVITWAKSTSIILIIRITRGTVIKDHGAVRYNMDFVNMVETEEGKIR